ERPDVDTIYMQAVQAMSGQGGWPMTVFLTPDALPFFGGTYFPPQDRHGLRAFPDVLRAVAEAYRTRRDDVTGAGARLRAAMARGGIFDQAGCGFHRYSVDDHWAVPHFEKMLYDNAQLAPVYLHAYQLTGRADFLEVSVRTLDYMARELRLSGGGFAASQDA